MSDSEFNTGKMHEWLARWHKGDQAAGNELFSRVAGRLERLARKALRGCPLVRSDADTGDLVGNAQVRLVRRLVNVRPAGTRDFFNLAAVELRRALIDLVRHVRQRPGRALATELPDRHVESAEELELWANFHEAVGSLPDELREVFHLKIYQGLKSKEVAEVIQVSANTARRRYIDAEARLRFLLNGQFPMLDD